MANPGSTHAAGKRAEDTSVLLRRDAILEAVGFAAERFLRSESWEDTIDDVLERLGEATHSSRVYVFRNRRRRDGELVSDQIYEWCAPGVSPGITLDWNHNWPYLPDYAHHVEALSNGETLVFRLSDAPPIDHQDLVDESTLSTACAPIFTADEWWGYLGFDDCVVEREWAKSELDALRAATATLGAAIERERADRERQEAEERYKALVEQMPAVSYIEEVVDPADFPYPTTFISPQIEELIGYSPDELVADPGIWERIVHPEDRDILVTSDMEAARANKRYESEYRLISRDGRTVWVHDEAVVLSARPQGHQIWHGVMHDITALREALESEQEVARRLRALDEMKDTFLNAVSHDLRTPVSAILGLSLTLQRGEGLKEEEKSEFASRIATNALKLQRLVDDLLNLDRLTRGVIELDREKTELSTLVARVLEETDLASKRPVEYEAEPTYADVDPAKVERMVENLLLNALRHTPDGTRIHISVRPGASGALIKVEDEGPGVLPDLREEIFEPFRQTGQSASPGAGIGLSLVARFAELHGGKAWVEEREGGGASFRVFLPISKPA